MMQFPSKLQKKLQDREESNSLRNLSNHSPLVDFSSNDYLGFASDKKIFDRTHAFLSKKEMYYNGATGSRLLTGNHKLYTETEVLLSKFHNAEAALLFNSGYDANIGFFSAVPQRGDVIFYDELIHASIRDGIQMSNAKSYKFKHNSLHDLQKRYQQIISNIENPAQSPHVYVVTESVFSMDGDTPDLHSFASFCKKHQCHFIVDEAHAVGIFGNQGVGLLQQLGIENQVFARIITFGKAMGCHGAVVLGSTILKTYLTNYARSLIYTTGLPPHSLATIITAYEELKATPNIIRLHDNIRFFNQKLKEHHLEHLFIKSNSAIHCCIVPGNKNIKSIAHKIQQKNFDIKPILHPTVPKGQERLRFCIHSYNSVTEISEVIELLATFVGNQR